ncbi:hypothetical protein [Streptomyces himalayensis]|uniref:Uncharacterized protein n=1 Tax=Streptomyces himalayensis subsp. himalayensis TaxID=2756131 RepID=A0A7W0DPV4_9ACTN|nr:hypothetical protein [Streptomyces himalayensis]MBA2948264.1 hypothetical protein [Streptomyces himalayensis subsp. himalayensis]
MAVTRLRALSIDTLTGLARRRPPLRVPPLRLTVPSGMSAPLGCDAVAVPAAYGQQLLARLPRAGCVYGDGAHWWWLVPSDSDVAMEWPAPVQYATGAVMPDMCAEPGLIHRPDGTSVVYTPPIPLYLAVCQVTGARPAWSRPVTA